MTLPGQKNNGGIGLRKNRRARRVLLWILAAVTGGLLLGKPLMGLYREMLFYLGDPTEAEIQVMAYAKAHDLAYGAYPESMIALLERNPETETFVLEYPVYQEQDYALPEYENSDTVPLFLQWDQRWGYNRYGSDVMGITGCGPTCLAMVGYYLTGDAETFDPAAVARFAEENGYYASGYGSSWTLISEGGVTLGLDVTEIPLVKKRMVDNLAVGNPIILAMGEGDFTSTGHYIVIVGMRDGMFVVNDPNSVANSQKLWSYEQLEDQIRNLWVIR